MAGLVGGVYGALNIEALRKLDGLTGLRGNCCSELVVDGGEAAFHGRREMARQEEAEWEIVLACRLLA